MDGEAGQREAGLQQQRILAEDTVTEVEEKLRTGEMEGGQVQVKQLTSRNPKQI